MAMKIVFQIILLLCSFAGAADVIDSKCPQTCGNVSIPYPFGIGAGCYLEDWFEIGCDFVNSSDSFRPHLRRFNNTEVLGIQIDGQTQVQLLPYNTIRVNYPIVKSCDNKKVTKENDVPKGSPFFFSPANNSFVAMGCNNSATVTSLDETVTYSGCSIPFCTFARSTTASTCNGTADCCQTTIPSGLGGFTTTIDPLNPEDNSSECKYAFLVDQNWFLTNFRVYSNPLNVSSVPVVMTWGINSTSFESLFPKGNYDAFSTQNYSCFFQSSYYLVDYRTQHYSCCCEFGYKGNPYLPEGCTDIDECADPKYNSQCTGGKRCINTLGSFHCAHSPVVDIIIGINSGLGGVLLLVGGWFLNKVIKKRQIIKTKEKFFKRNGGLLLQQQLSSSEGNVENTKLFTSNDLEHATDHFNKNRVLGQGGQGTVYKGMLIDGRIVAVKKSKQIDEGKLQEFINEVVILAQINHRNIVKLLGCCLETEVPLLVYEFVPNGTLSQYLDGQNDEFPPTWDMRLRIATEVARALFYLHSVALSPIYHRDIKSTNILLDDKYRAKVADFGTSRTIAIDQTHLTTLVYGTFGYLDPEYFQSSQFTEKSDVYSYGVVLAELLTGEKAISSTRALEAKSLATYFIQSMEENNLFGILDKRVMKEAQKQEIVAVANLAERCLNLNGRKRPTMREISVVLEAIQMLRKATNDQQNNEVVEDVRIKRYEQFEVLSTSSMSVTDNGTAATPLLSSELS